MRGRTSRNLSPEAARPTRRRLRAPSSLVPMLPRVKAPKILAVASAVDLDYRYGCTPAWWQLWKGLYEVGVDLIVTPYRGRPIESPWWRTAPNPTRAEGESFAAVRAGLARVKGDRYLRRAEDTPDETAFDKVARETIWRWVTPRWRRHLTRVLEAEKDVDAVVVFTVPMAHFRGIPDLPARALRRAGRLLRRRRADEPARVRRHGHGLQLLPRRRPVRVRPRRLQLGGRARAAARARAPGAPRRSSGAPTRSSSRRGRSRRCTTSSSTATATSSAATGWRRWSASRAAPRRSSSSRSAAATSRATPAARGSSATYRSTSSRRRSRRRGST